MEAVSKIENVSREAASSGLPPAYAVSVTWNELLNTLQDAVKKRLPEEYSDSWNPRRTIKLALDSNLITKEDYNLLEELTVIRNQVAHGKEVNLTESDALRYGDVAAKLASRVVKFVSERV
jgi:uncharacterized protein YutE (UPF0331/DUF86 family)